MAITEKYVTAAGAGAADGSSLANALSWAAMVTAINAGGTAGTRYNVDAAGGTISRTTTTDAISGSGTITSPVIIRGYNSSNGAIGTGYQGRTNGNGALITTNMPFLTYSTGRLNITGNFIIFESINVTGATTLAAVVIIGSDCKARSCSFANTATGAASACATTAGTRATFFDCDGTQSGASGGAAAFGITGIGSKIESCRITSVSGPGVTMSNTSSCMGSTIFNCGTNGVSLNNSSSSCTVCRNTIYGCASDGINVVTGTAGCQDIYNNLLTDNGGYGLDMVSTSNGVFSANNRYRNNTTAAIGQAGDWNTAGGFNDVSGSGAASVDYTNSGSGDFSLIATSPAVNAGSPLYASIGALQRSQSSSGGITRLVNGGFVREMKYLGDFNTGTTIRFSFNTTDATGAPITLAGTPALSIYKSGSTTETTNGVTLTVDYDSRTGYHHASVDMSSDGTFYTTGGDFRAVITTGTVSGTSVVGTEVAQWSIENRNQWADLRKILGTALTETSGYLAAGFKKFFNVATPTGTMNQIDLVDAPNSTALTAIGAAIWAALTSALTTVGSIGKLLVTNVDAKISSVSGGGGGGSGAYTVTATVNDGTNPIQGATVAMVINSSRYTALTNASGVATLTPTEGNGTYTVSIVAIGYQFTQTTLVVSGDTSHTYSMTQISLNPSPSGSVTGYIYTTEADGTTIEPNVVVSVRMTKVPTGSVGSLVDPVEITETSDSGGLVQFTGLLPGATYAIKTTRSQDWKTFVAGSVNFDIGSVIA